MVTATPEGLGISGAMLFLALSFIFLLVNMAKDRIILKQYDKLLKLLFVLGAFALGSVFMRSGYIAQVMPWLDYHQFISEGLYVPYVLSITMLGLIAGIQIITQEKYPKLWMIIAAISAIIGLTMYAVYV